MKNVPFFLIQKKINSLIDLGCGNGRVIYFLNKSSIRIAVQLHAGQNSRFSSKSRFPIKTITINPVAATLGEPPHPLRPSSTFFMAPTHPSSPEPNRLYGENGFSTRHYNGGRCLK